MAVGMEKATSHYVALLTTTRRGRAILVPIIAVAAVFTLINIANRAYRQQPSVNLERAPKTENVSDWSRFAYVQYATSSEYLCNAVMLLQSLHRLKSRADRVLMYPAKMLPDPEDVDGGGFQEGELLVKARDEYGVKLVPIQVQHKDTADDTWANSYTKLLAFNQTQYERVIAIDSDTTLLKHMDELFYLPPCPVAMPRAYWLLGNKTTKETLASHLLVIQPSEHEFGRIQRAIQLAADDEYDMEVLNKLYRDAATVLPHWPYTMMSSEFRQTNHSLYLGSDAAEWDPTAVMGKVRAVHFSDYPVPKPWKKFWNTDDVENFIKSEPKCEMKSGNDKEEDWDCSGRDAWRALYVDFKSRKATVCARKSWPNSKEVDLGPLRGEAMVGLNPVPYVEQDDTFSVLMSMDRNDFTH